MNRCESASSGTCVYETWMSCSPGIYLLTGWSWKSGVNVQPQIDTSVRI